MVIATLTSKGQVTIPVELRRAMSLRPGDRLVFSLGDDGLRVRAIRKRPASELRGSVRSDRRFPGRKAVRKEAAVGLAKRHIAENGG